MSFARLTRTTMFLVLVLLVSASGLSAQDMMYSEAPILAEQVASR